MRVPALSRWARGQWPHLWRRLRHHLRLQKLIEPFLPSIEQRLVDPDSESQWHRRRLGDPMLPAQMPKQLPSVERPGLRRQSCRPLERTGLLCGLLLKRELVGR